MNNMKRRLAVRAIIVHDGKLLCSRAKPYSPAVDTNAWGVPGGGIDYGESLLPALKREIIEELGIKPVIGNLVFIQQFINKLSRIEQLEFFFYIKNPSDYLNIDLPKTSHGHLEIAEVKFINPTMYPILPRFLAVEPLDKLVNRPVKIFDYL